MIKKNETISKKMGEKIRKLRREKNWSQAQLADKLGIHPQTVSDAERGENRFTIERLLRFFDALGYDAEIILQERDLNQELELQEIKDTLAKHCAELKSDFNVKRIGVFGSWARQEAKPGSDIDLLVEFKAGKEGGGIKLQRLKRRISNWFDREIDVTPSYALSNEEFSRAVKQEITYV